MRHLMLILAISLPLLGCATAGQSEDLRVLYHDHDFYLPADPVLMAYLGSDNNILAVKYSEQQGKQYVSFSVEPEFEAGGCSFSAFFTQVLNGVDQGCDELAVRSFEAVFVRDRESGVWSGGDRQFFYFLSPKRSTVFLVSPAEGGTLYKVESDFLDKASLKGLFSQYL